VGEPVDNHSHAGDQWWFSRLFLGISPNPLDDHWHAREDAFVEARATTLRFESLW